MHLTTDHDDELMTKRPKLEVIVGKCKKEDFSSCSEPLEQPLYIDEPDEAIKCSWCPDWHGSQKTKVINQHVTKSVSHSKARKRHLCLSDEESDGESGRQLDIRTFFY